MCGIIGYIGSQPALPLLMEGLKRLEYRGYDSAGISLLDSETLIVARAVGEGNISALPKLLNGQGKRSTVGVAHTRWATHGAVEPKNAHPHAGCAFRSIRRTRFGHLDSAKITVVHNGTIENFASLKKYLEKRGHTFRSDTDTEVLVHLIEERLRQWNGDLTAAVGRALRNVEGTYGIVVQSVDHPDELVAAAHGSPIVIGPAVHGTFVASAIDAFMRHTRRRVDLEDGHIVHLTAGRFSVRTIDGRRVQPTEEKITETIEQVEKGGYRHFMEKEIKEQPLKLADTIAGRIAADGTVRLGGFRGRESLLVKAKNVHIDCCGTSWHAGLIFEEMLEGIAQIPSEVNYASEFAGRPKQNSVLPAKTVAFAISQSGETQDTIRAVKKLREMKVPVFGICNAVGTKIPRLCGAGVYIHVGREIGVASTKAFTGQVMAAALISLYLADRRKVKRVHWRRKLGRAIARIPRQIETILRRERRTRQIVKLARKFFRQRNALYLGRGINFPVALEGALKLKEISYIHAEGYPAGEMKHGPIALIDGRMPVVVIALKKHDEYDKVCSNIQEIKARKGVVIAIAEDGDRTIRKIADHVITIPPTSYWLSPLLTVVPLQLFAYEIARLRKCKIDKPRNLAKSVTVE